MTCGYRAKLQRLLKDINEDVTLNPSDRMHLLDTHDESIKASLRHARRTIRGDVPVVAPTGEVRARKAIRRLLAEGKDPSAMSDSQLLAIGGVGTRTLEAISKILAKQG